MFNIGISGFHTREGLGSKGYKVVVLYEGCSQSKSGKNKIFSRSGNCQEILKNVREFSPFDLCKGIVREFCHDFFFRLRVHHMVRYLPGLW